jgi:flagellar basal-body rod protein FlgB
MKPSSITDLLYKQLAFRGDRQKVIASNIANLNTPSYKTKDISFANHLKQAQSNNDLKLKVTNKNHIAFDTIEPKSQKNQPYEIKNLQEQNDGNNVNLDQQISEMAKNSVMYDAVTNSIKKDSRWFKLILESSSKN